GTSVKERGCIVRQASPFGCVDGVDNAGTVAAAAAVSPGRSITGEGAVLDREGSIISDAAAAASADLDDGADHTSVPSDGRVARKGAVRDGGGSGSGIRDGPTCGVAPAAAPVGLVCQERAVADSKATGTVQDGTTAGCAAAADADRLVLAEQAGANSQRGTRNIGNGPALGGAAGIAQGLVVRQHVPGQCQTAAGVHDGAAAVAPEDPAIGERQPGDGDRHAAADGKDLAGLVAADGQLVGPQALDVEALGEGQLAASQRDGLAVEAGVEDDLIPALGGGDHCPQRPVAAVGWARDRPGARYSPLFEGFDLRQESPSGESRGPVCFPAAWHCRATHQSVPHVRKRHDLTSSQLWRAG